MLHGGAQRPQVLTILEAPNKIDLIDLKQQSKATGVFSLFLSFDKRVRSVELPNVILPKKLYRALTFHVVYILPTLYQTHNIQEGDPRRR